MTHHQVLIQIKCVATRFNVTMENVMIAFDNLTIAFLAYEKKRRFFEDRDPGHRGVDAYWDGPIEMVGS